MAEKLAENDNEVYEIEVDPKAADEAKKFCKDVIVTGIEKFSLGELLYAERLFDVIILCRCT